MEFRRKLVGSLWRLFGQKDTGTVVYPFPNVAQHSDPEVIDAIGEQLATGTGITYDPENHDDF